MRELGMSPNREQAALLADYLLTQDIPAVIREEGGQFVLWVRNEDDLERATAIWTEFRANPGDSKYVSSRKPAQLLRKKSEEAERKYATLYQDAYDFWGRPAPSRVPLTMTLIVVSVVISLWSQFGRNFEVTRWFSFTDQPRQLWFAEDDPLAEQIERALHVQQTESLRQGELWRLITPIFLHFGWLHLVLNAYALFSLGGLVEYRRGVWWTLFFVLATGVISNMMEFLLPSWFQLDPRYRGVIGGGLFGGLSGIIYAFFGYLLAKTLYDLEPGLRIPKDTIVILLVWLVVCMTGWIGPIANTAHVAGLVAGFIIGAVPKAWRRHVLRR